MASSATNSSEKNSNSTTKNAVSSPLHGDSELIAAETSTSPPPPLPPSSMSSPASVSDREASISMAEEESGSNDGNAGKRTAWNKLSGGAVEIGPGIDPGSWPALSDSARVSVKSSSSSDSIVKGPSSSDGSLLTVSSQGTGTFFTQKRMNNNSNPNATPNSTPPARQRSMRRNGASVPSNAGGPQPPGSRGPGGEANLSNHAPRDHAQRNSQARASNDHTQQQQLRNSYTNRNGVPNFRGNGSQNPNYRGRRDQDRANQDWLPHQNFNGRDARMQPPRVVPSLRHPTPHQLMPPNYAPFIPQPMPLPMMRPFSFPIEAPRWSFVPAPISWNMQAMMPPYPAPDFPLHTKILMQIDYYFSNENLIRDTFLRQKMDDQGWVSVTLIAKFNKVAALTDDIHLILDSLRSSSVVEVQGDKIRRRNDWSRWIMPSEMRGNSLEENAKGNSSSSSQADALSNLSLQSSSTGNGQVASHGDLNGSSSAANLS